MDIRNSTQETLLRIDTNEGVSSPVRGIYFHGGHIHHVTSGYIALGNTGSAALPEKGICAFIGESRVVRFIHTSFVTGDVEDCAGLYLGSQSTSKSPTIISAFQCRVTGGADRQVGFLGSPGFNDDANSSFTENSIDLSGSDAEDEIDVTVS